MLLSLRVLLLCRVVDRLTTWLNNKYNNQITESIYAGHLLVFHILKVYFEQLKFANFFFFQIFFTYVFFLRFAYFVKLTNGTCPNTNETQLLQHSLEHIYFHSPTNNLNDAYIKCNACIL